MDKDFIPQQIKNNPKDGQKEKLIGDEQYTQFAIIKGKVADDKVYRVVNMYINGFWDKQRILSEIKVYPDYDQIAFISQKAIDELLTFKQSIRIML